MYVAIDGRPLIRQPQQVEFAPAYTHQVSQSGGGRPLVHPGSYYSQINCVFGVGMSYEATVRELARRRANEGVHAITVETSLGRRLTLNCYMTEPAINHVGQDVNGKHVVSGFTVSFIQVDTPRVLFPMRLHGRGILAVSNGFAYSGTPAAGTVVAVDGFLHNLGAGAGATSVQVSIDGTDVMTAAATFPVGGDHTLQGVTLDPAGVDFEGNVLLSLDVDGIPAGGLSAEALITVWALMFKP